jgi:hypothetical protein
VPLQLKNKHKVPSQARGVAIWWSTYPLSCHGIKCLIHFSSFVLCVWKALGWVAFPECKARLGDLSFGAPLLYALPIVNHKTCIIMNRGKNKSILNFVMKCKLKIPSFVFKRKMSDGSSKMPLRQIHKYELRWKQSIETKKVQGN